jgi:hypothetical protein
MTVWDKMDEETKLAALPKTPARIKRLKALRISLTSIQKAYERWNAVTPLHINKI